MPYKDKEKQRAFQAKWRREKSRKLREKVWKLKDKPCKDCGIKYPPYVMDFDHVKGGKINSVSRLASNGGMEAVHKEVKKCEVVCANCHRIRTYNRIRRKDDTIKV